MEKYLEGKVAIVTGSGQGIGRAIAIELARYGAKVVTNNRSPVKVNTSCGHISDDMLKDFSEEQRAWYDKEMEVWAGDAESTAQAIRDEGGEAVSFFGDIADFEVAGELVETAVKEFGSIDLIYNVAGAFGLCPIEKMDLDLWNKVTAVKPLGYFNVIRHAVPYMIEKKWGRIVNCTSRAWLGDILKHAEYCAANAGAVGLTRGLAIELADKGITCNAFAPFARSRAGVELEIYDKIVKAQDKAWIDPNLSVSYDSTPMPDLIAPFLVYLATDAASHINGSVFNVNGNRIGLYSEPEMSKVLFKDGEKWSVEELIQKAPKTLFMGYQSLPEKW